MKIYEIVTFFNITDVIWKHISYVKLLSLNASYVYTPCLHDQFIICARCIICACTCNRCEQQQHSPTTVNSMLSNSKAMKTINRISLRDCLSSLSHVNKLKSLRASNSPILINSNCQRASEKDPATEKKLSKKTSVASKHYKMCLRETWGMITTNMREICQILIK